MYTGHKDEKLVLRRKKRKNFVPKTCDCSRFDGLMYARPVLLRDETTDEVASFKMTLCLRVDRRQAGTSTSSSSNGGNNLIGMFLFLVPYPWNRSDEGTAVGLDSPCTKTDPSSSLGGDDPVVCAHVHYDSAEELLKTNVRTAGGRPCLCVTKIDRRRMPKEATVGLASRIAGDPIKLDNILTWSFHSTLESKDPPLSLPPHAPATSGSRGEQRLRLDPWNRNAELNLRYQRNWHQLSCSISVTLGCGNNANEDTD
ncbi:uncharacterized protein [Miscanthus floridulus]|uniref:uncharacterized protein n=1 Tax=Miscanthus floridulus TaxID=154761 RepID=UPI00345A5434